MKTKASFSIVLGITLLLASCAKEGPTGPIGPSGLTYTGTISGHVSLYDQYGNKVLVNLDSMLVSLSGGAYISPDSTGFYTYANVATGIYSIGAISAYNNYGATNTNDFQFLSGTLNKDIKLSAIPAFSLTFTANTTATGDSLVINCAADQQARNCIVFVSNASSVSSAVTNYLVSFVKQIPANSSQVALVINKQALYDAGITSGSTAYYALYSYVVNDQSVYEDQTTGKNVYNSVNNLQTGSAIVP